MDEKTFEELNLPEYEHLPDNCKVCPTRRHYMAVIDTLLTGVRPAEDLMADKIVAKTYEIMYELQQLREAVKDYNESNREN